MNKRTGDQWSLYIVECRDGSYYTGIAKDVAKRVEAHNAGKGSKYTRTHNPVRLVFQEPQGDYSTALRREYQVKTVPKSRKVRLVQGETLPPPALGARMSFIRRKKKKARRGARARKRRTRSALKKGGYASSPPNQSKRTRKMPKRSAGPTPTPPGPVSP